MRELSSSVPLNANICNAGNINLLWGRLIIEELSRLGVKHVCIAPGSRSTPLTLAVAEQSKITPHCHFDERGLGFFALGLAKASNQAVAIITTSGSAVANLVPAIVEAYQSKVPLLIFSADRPDELLDCAANQAIAQKHLFTDFVVHQSNLPTASTEVLPSFLLTTIDNAYAKLTENLGPVQINCMFREPLYAGDQLQDFSDYLTPCRSWLNSDQAFTRYHQSRRGGEVIDTHWLTQLNSHKALIIIGQMDSKQSALAIRDWGQAQGWPIIADCQSQLKGESGTLNYADQLLNNEAFAKILNEHTLIIQFGTRIVSKRVNQFIKQSCNERATPYWLVAEGSDRIDPDHIVSVRFVSHTDNWLNQVQSAQGLSWGDKLNQYDNAANQLLNDFDNTHSELSEYWVCRQLAGLLPQDCQVFLGNSMPIRAVDMFSQSFSGKVYTNRGASGIDGLVATATGIKASDTAKPLVLLIGDTSLLHDLNSLAWIRQQPIVIIVLNNDGGAIFNILPVPEQPKSQFYQMPHGLEFEHAASMFELNYHQPNNQAEFVGQLSQALSASKGTLIEVCVPPSQLTQHLKQIKDRITELIS